MLVLILTGDVERSHTLEVTREGFVVIPQVGQVYVANLTLGEVAGAALPAGSAGSTPACGATAPGSTRFQLSLAKLRNIQVYVAGDVVRPGRVPDLERRHRADRAVRGRRADHQRHASVG